MDILKTISDLAALVPLSTIAKEKLDLLKLQVETMEGRLKLKEDQLKWSEDERSKSDAVKKEQEAELRVLRETVAALSLGEGFEMRGSFAYKKGSDLPLCPDCKKTLSQQRLRYTCRACGWEHEEVPTLSVGTISF